MKRQLCGKNYQPNKHGSFGLFKKLCESNFFAFPEGNYSFLAR